MLRIIITEEKRTEQGLVSGDKKTPWVRLYKSYRGEVSTYYFTHNKEIFLPFVKEIF